MALPRLDPNRARTLACCLLVLAGLPAGCGGSGAAPAATTAPPPGSKGQRAAAVAIYRGFLRGVVSDVAEKAGAVEGAAAAPRPVFAARARALAAILARARDGLAGVRPPGRVGAANRVLVAALRRDARVVARLAGAVARDDRLAVVALRAEVRREDAVIRAAVRRALAAR